MNDHEALGLLLKKAIDEQSAVPVDEKILKDKDIKKIIKTKRAKVEGNAETCTCFAMARWLP